MAGQPTIDGGSRLIGIVGAPISQVRSPTIYNPRILAAGHNAVLVPIHLPAADFEPGMRGLMMLANLAGLIITYPFKERAIAFVERVGLIGSQVGAINAMRRESDGSWTGDMFDGAGLLAALEGLGQSAAGRSICLIGGGGAGSAIAMALAGAGAASLRICDRNESRASKLADRVAGIYPSCIVACGLAQIDGTDLLINATPVGMAPNFAMAPFVGDLHRGVTVIDIVPAPEKTRLLELAQAVGCPNANGQAMISGQADVVLKFFGLAKK